MIAKRVKDYQSALNNLDLAKKKNFDDGDLLQEEMKSCETLQLEAISDDSTIDEIGVRVCNIALNMKPGGSSPYKLSFAALPKIPWIANCLELEEDSENGKFIVAKESLKVGDIIAIEKPLSAAVLMSGSCYMCTFCRKFDALNLIPCPNCSKAMFCSESCRDQATFHNSFECQSLAKIFYHDPASAFLLRAFFTSLAAFDGDMNAMENYVKENTGKTLFDLDFSDESRSELVKNLVVAVNQRSVSNKWFFSTEGQRNIATKVREAIRMLPRNIKNLIMDNKAFAFEYLMKLAENMSISPYSYEEHYQAGFYASNSLTQRSCAPNVHRILYRNEMLVHVVIFPIPRGEPLTISRFCGFKDTPKTDRIEIQKYWWNYECSCVACRNNFPTRADIAVRNKTVLKKVQEHIDREPTISFDERQQLTSKYAAYIDHNIEHYPTLEMVLMQDFVKNKRENEAQKLEYDRLFDVTL